jgi:quinol monooxygenase YgiN
VIGWRDPGAAVLLIAGSIRIDPIRRDELIATAREVVRELRKQAGCTQVLVSADLEDPSLLHLIQTWESQEALTANLKTRRIDAIRDVVGKLGLREMALLKYEVTSVGPIT